VEAARFCDNIFAVGDYVVKELRFLRKEFANVHIDLAYNGVSRQQDFQNGAPALSVLNLKGRKRLSQWLREVDLRNLPFLLRALRRTQGMMNPSHYLREYALAPELATPDASARALSGDTGRLSAARR